MLQRGQGLLGRLAGTAVRAIVPARSVTATSAAAADVSTRVQYVKRQDKKDLFYYAAPPPEEVGRITNLEPESVVVRLEDLRNKQQMQWQRNGFELIQFPGVQSVCWDDKDQVKQTYYSQVESLLKQKTGASNVCIMAHNLRRGKAPKRKEDLSKPPAFQEVFALTHVDFTDSSAPKLMQAYMGEEAEELSKKPWGIIQVWRPLVGPVQDSPLGLVDATTVSKKDMIPVSLYIPGGHKHEINFFVHNPSHRWYWTSQMQADEAYMFVNYDSRHDGRPRFTPHAAIADANTSEDVPIRESIETRALVFWD